MKSETDQPTRVALYARVSKLNHGQDTGLQLEELRQVALQRGWVVVHEFVDEGISGSKTDRPALNDLLDDARVGRFDLVAVWKIDRMGRSLQHLLQVLDELSHIGVGFVSLHDPGLDSTSPTGRLMLSIVGAFAEYERKLIQERVRAGVSRAQSAGVHCGRPQREMDLRPALSLFKEGHGLKAISRMLGIDRATLRRRLQEAGEWPRRGGFNSPPENEP